MVIMDLFLRFAVAIFAISFIVVGVGVLYRNMYQLKDISNMLNIKVFSTLWAGMFLAVMGIALFMAVVFNLGWI